MNRTLRLCLILAATWAGAGAVLADTIALPLQFQQDFTSYNLQSFGGVAISTNASSFTTNVIVVAGNPTSTNLVGPASDGRMSPTNSSRSSLNYNQFSINPPTTNQFQSLLWFGAVPGLGPLDATNSPLFSNLRGGTNRFSGAVAQEMRLPVGQAGGQVAIVMRRALIGAPFLGQQVSFGFGAQILPPLTFEDGATLLPTNSAYWLPKPYTNSSSSTSAPPTRRPRRRSAATCASFSAILA